MGRPDARVSVDASNHDTRAQARRLSISADPVAPGPPNNADERRIVASVLAGDRDAFRLLVDQESASVIRACYRVLGDHAEAEDAAQEAFVTAYRALASWRSDGPFGAWVSRIAVRIALRQVSKRRTVTWRSPARDRLDDTTLGAADLAVERVSISAAARTDPSAVAIRSERAAEIRRAVTDLPEPYREVVVLRFFAESSLLEIARQTGRPLATVKTQLYRGLARLRSDLGDRPG